jgi:LuxR family maltose regulon positive regulatory protein
MAAPILTTKLYVPPARPERVSRPRLIQRLDEGLRPGHRLTLLSAAAGFGKTTLLSDWIHQRNGPVAWLSLDAADNAPGRFWTHVVAALQTVYPEMGRSVLAALGSPNPPPMESLLTALINELAATQAPLTLVLDDYHAVKERAIHEGLSFLLEHLPPQVHLVLASRTDPRLPLHRLRGRGQLIELRVADLRFTPDEAATFLHAGMGLALSAEDVNTLEQRTEGWITGLQLAALSMQGQADISGFVRAFAGSHRFVLDYLVEEVLSQQPRQVQRFLLETSILDRLSGPLCDAVWSGESHPGSPGEGEPVESTQVGQEILEALEQRNLFLVPLDGARRWYRTHRLFADLLRSQYQRLGDPLGCAPVDELHRRACAWYEAQGFLDEAVHHALAAGEAGRAADLVEGHGLEMLKQGELTALLRWLEALPAEHIQDRPRLCVHHAWALALTGQLDAVEPHLQAAERGTETSPLDDQPGHVAAIRAYVAAQRGDLPRATELAQQALAWLHEENLVVRSVVAFTLGGAYLLAGDRVAAARAFSEASEMGQAGGNLHLAVPASAHLADLEVEQGRLHRAFAAYRRAWEMAGPSPVAAQAHSGMAAVLYEWNDLEAAAHHLDQSIELGELWGNVDALSGDYVMQAWLRRAQGNLSGAEGALQEAEELAQTKGLHPHAAAEVAAGRVRLALARDDLAVVERWVHDCGLDGAGEIRPAQERAFVILARALLALGQAAAARRLLARLLETIEGDGRWGRGIETLVLQALTYRAEGDPEQAFTALERALTQAQPEGYVRTFVDEGEPLRSLLTELRTHLADQAAAADIGEREHRLAYVRELLEAFTAPEGGEPPARRVDDGRRTDGGLVEPLSERELEVLRLVAAGLTNQAIADRLFIAVSTVKSHTNSIYGKLGVRNRTQAVAQAQALGLQ